MAFVDRGVAAGQRLLVLVELKLRVVAQEQLVDLLLQLGAVPLGEFLRVEVAAGQQAVDDVLLGVGGMRADLLHRCLGELAGPHHRQHEPIDDLMDVVAEGHAARVEVQRLPEALALDAEQANLLVERQHLEDLGQVDTGEIPA